MDIVQGLENNERREMAGVAVNVAQSLTLRGRDRQRGRTLS